MRFSSGLQPAEVELRLTLIAAVLALIATVRVVATYPVFSQTFDEPAHIAAGMEWLEFGTYNYEPLHPPIARVAAAIGPFLAGVRVSARQRAMLEDPSQWRAVTANSELWTSGNDILHAGGRYMRNLTLARLGILPFLLLALFITWKWARAWYGPAVAAVAVLLLSSMPALLAHAGVATTDVPLTAMGLLAIYAFVLWIQEATWTRTIAVGATWGLAIATKFSALVYLPACAAAILAWYLLVERRRGATPSLRRLRNVAPLVTAAAAIAIVAIWGSYRFALRPFTTADDRPHLAVDSFAGMDGSLRDAMYTAVETPLPLTDFVRGIHDLAEKNEGGQSAFFLGRYSTSGWWYFFAVALAIKTPIGFILLAAAGAVAMLLHTRRERDWRLFVPVLCAGAALVTAMISNLNVGSRHVLLVYPLLSIGAGYGAVHLWRSGTHGLLARGAVSAAIAWHLVSGAIAHPDYLAYFNEIANSSPEEFVVDSDLDWGQDLKRLTEELHRRGVPELSIRYQGSADLDRFDLPPFRHLERRTPTTGWVAISLFQRTDVGGAPTHDGYDWLEEYEPVTTVGRTIRLYYIPPPEP